MAPFVQSPFVLVAVNASGSVSCEATTPDCGFTHRKDNAVAGPSVLQGTPLDLSRPWRRATMHDLVKEATGVDFASFEGDVEKARAAALEAVAAAGGNTRSPSLRTATSVGYLLNEVRQHTQRGSDSQGGEVIVKASKPSTAPGWMYTCSGILAT